MKRSVVAFLSGLLFSAGLCVSGMTRPSKVLGFLDVFGSWDPSLALVMLGAVSVSAIAFRVARRRVGPVLGGEFSIPGAGRALEARVIAGAALFGVGWGLSGLCPGPAVVSLAGGQTGAFVFMAAMVVGMALSPPRTTQPLSRRIAATA
jgi:uncharacterized membrane protein YedE/YeeE